MKEKAAATAGDSGECLSESEESIIRRHDRLIGFFARRFRVDPEDLVQVGRVALLEAFRRWPLVPHNASFWTYARKAVVGEMSRYVTREIEQRTRSLEIGLEPAPDCPPDLSAEAKEHISSLATREASILAMYTAGFDAPEIAAQHNITRQRVYQILEGSVENIRKHA